MPFLLILLVVASALGQPIQIAANSRLREAVQSPALSALVAFVVGGMLLAVLVMLGLFERGDLRGLTKVPWWAWTGGVLAVFSILAGIVALPRMSSATIIGAAIFGQLIASTLVAQRIRAVTQHPVVAICRTLRIARQTAYHRLAHPAPHAHARPRGLRLDGLAPPAHGRGHPHAHGQGPVGALR
jgi:transporter family-2 protein